MGSVNMDCEMKREMDDSGCVQDDGVPASQVGLLDLSDDVLLYILRHCSPRDLKALGYSCSRLGVLVQERSLWRRVDARDEPCSGSRLAWFIDNTLHHDTHTLMISGYARNADGCLGLINVSRDEAESEREPADRGGAPSHVTGVEQLNTDRHQARFFVTQRAQHLPRFRGVPSWPDRRARRGPQACRGPQFSVGAPLMSRLTDTCPRLDTLALEYCCIDCNTTSLSSFPRGLRRLSLRGSRCYNMTIDKSFLFKIQDYLPALESLDVSECEWMDPATLLPLSKLPALQQLFLRDCHKLAEFVAYASLTARYGFRTLKVRTLTGWVLDLRGSPVGDSEVSALGWLPQLERLWLAAARGGGRSLHAHYTDDRETEHEELQRWETAEREYFKCRPSNGTHEETSPDCKYDEREETYREQRTDGPTCDVREEKIENKKRKTTEETDGEGGKRARNSPDCIVDCIKIDQLIDVGELRRGRQNEVIVIANSARVRSPAPQGEEGGVNQGASTSREQRGGGEEDEQGNEQHEQGNEQPPPVQYQVEPRHHVLYVSVGPQVNTYRFPRDAADLERQVGLGPAPGHVDSSSLVTDFAIRRFGRADGEDVNIIHIGPNGPMLVGQSAGSRPDRSSLRYLSVTGYRNITDRSLAHLASAAPRLVSLDFRDTNVSEEGARNFLALRPDCELVYSAFVDKKNN
ncbi:unnamed protein product [Danaus chrysippus]|uniref:(African queen) hypothetical protein n=1 Tax=Danaus chrysippus TaxID=151541 RepID=A0A8J2VV14_9NEOP|nr:unnamed protein product [Danaus chrysippus]